MTAPQVRQATCVAIEGRGVLIEGPPGSGKSTLALKLIDRGADLVGDDGVELSRVGRQVIAAPVSPIAGLIEARNVGLLTMPSVKAPLALVLRLAADAPRFVDHAETAELLGVAIPRLWFDPAIAAAAIRAELALARHGLRFDLPSTGDPAHNC